MAASNADWARALAAIRYGSGGGTGNVSLKDLQKFAKSQSNMYGSPGAGIHQSTIGSIGSAFKNAGSTALNVLSVPQAMLFTAGSKTIDALTGGKMKSTMGWDEMLGGFSPNYHGYKEIIQQVGEPMGLSKDSALGTWGGLAGDLALDPLWFVAPAKLVKGGGESVKALSAITKGADAGRFAPGVSKDAGTTAMLNKFAMTPTERAIDLNRTSRAISNDAGTTAMLAKFAKTTPFPPVVPSQIGQASKALKSEKVTLRVEGGGLGINAGAQAAGRTTGTKVGDFFIHEVTPRSRKAGGAPARVKIYRLTNPGRLHSEDAVISKTFTSPRKAEKWLRDRIDVVGGDYSRVEPRLVSMTDNGTASLHDVQRGIDMNIASQEARFNGAKNQMGIKFGVGKANPEGGRGLSGANFTVRTPIRLPSNKTVGTVTGVNKLGALFKRSPFEHTVNAAARAAREMQNVASMEDSIGARALHGLTEEQARAVYMAMDLTNASQVGIHGVADIGEEAFKQQFRKLGEWTPQMDTALKWAEGKFGAGWEFAGKSDSTYRELGLKAYRLSRELEGQGFALGDKEWRVAVKKARKAGEISASDSRILMGEGGTRGAYVMHSLDNASREAINEGKIVTASKLGRIGGKDAKRTHESIANFFTRDQYHELLQKTFPNVDSATLGGIVDDIGARLSLAEKEHFGGNFDGLLGFRDEVLPYRPEMNLYRVVASSDAKFINQTLRRSVDNLAVKHGLASWVGKKGKRKLVFENDHAKEAYKRAVKSADPGPLQANGAVQKWLKFSSGIKMYLTSMQGTNYWGNLSGDYFKTLVEGNIHHWKAPTSGFQLTGTLGGRATKGSRFAKLVNGDPKMLGEHFATIGGHKYNGAEVLWMSHMIGLGKGYAGAEIAELSKIFQASKGPIGIKQIRQFARWSTRNTNTREDGNRIQTWLRHMEGGDNMMEAGMKTVRAHFDYNDLTDFEKIYMRNMILFYTWSRKNIPFQVKSMAQKPGLYSSYGDIERDRPKMPGEPAYLGNMGLIPIPGFGAVNVSAPWADLNKIPLGPGGLRETGRQNILGALAPGFKQAQEVLSDTNTLTGGRLSQSKGTLPFVGEVPWWAAYPFKQYNPLVTQAGRISNTSSDPRDIIGLLGNLSGTVRRVQPDPKWTEKKAGG